MISFKLLMKKEIQSNCKKKKKNYYFSSLILYSHSFSQFNLFNFLLRFTKIIKISKLYDEPILY